MPAHTPAGAQTCNLGFRLSMDSQFHIIKHSLCLIPNIMQSIILKLFQTSPTDVIEVCGIQGGTVRGGSPKCPDAPPPASPLPCLVITNLPGVRPPPRSWANSGVGRVERSGHSEVAGTEPSCSGARTAMHGGVHKSGWRRPPMQQRKEPGPEPASCGKVEDGSQSPPVSTPAARIHLHLCMAPAKGNPGYIVMACSDLIKMVGRFEQRRLSMIITMMGKWEILGFQ